MEKWEKLSETCWVNETPLITASVVKAKGSKRWSIIVSGRQTFVVRVVPPTRPLRAVKAAATRLAKQVLLETSELL